MYLHKEKGKVKMQFVFSLMDEVTARAIQAWRYEGAYATYNLGSDQGGVRMALIGQS